MYTTFVLLQTRDHAVSLRIDFGIGVTTMIMMNFYWIRMHFWSYYNLKPGIAILGELGVYCLLSCSFFVVVVDSKINLLFK